MKKLIKKNIVIATHEYATGFPQHLRSYLSDHSSGNVLYIHHPLHPELREGIGSGYEWNSGKKRISSRSTRPVTAFGIAFFMKSLFLDIWWTLRSGERWDVYIGVNNLNALAGVVLKKFGLVKKSIYYTVDFIPHRFSNTFLNAMYLWIDKLCVKQCDETWILSPRIREGRHRVLHIPSSYDRKQIEVPEGIWLSRIKQAPFSSVSPHTGVFVGVLLERMGLQLVLQAMPKILKKIPDFRLIVIGKGAYEHELKRLITQLGIQKSVECKGYVEKFSDVEKIVARCAVGFAPYTTEKSGLTYFADPAKTKTYLGCSVPVVMTNMFHNACDIEKAGAGIVVAEKAGQIADAVLAIIHDTQTLKEYRTHALAFARQFDHDVIFKQNVGRILT